MIRIVFNCISQFNLFGKIRPKKNFMQIIFFIIRSYNFKGTGVRNGSSIRPYNFPPHKAYAH